MSKIYWNDTKKNFSKTHEFGADITKFVIDSDTDSDGKSVNDPRLEKWLRTGKVTTSKPDAKEPRMGEVDSLKAQVKTLEGRLKEQLTEFDVERAKHNKEGGGSLQSDLDRIAELESKDSSEEILALESKLELVKSVFATANKPKHIDENKFNEIKALFTEGE